MTTKSRLRHLEKVHSPANQKPLVIWSKPEESTEEAWFKAYGETPMPEDRQIIVVSWFSDGEPPKRRHENNDLKVSSETL